MNVNFFFYFYMLSRLADTICFGHTRSDMLVQVVDLTANKTFYLFWFKRLIFHWNEQFSAWHSSYE